MNIYGFLLVLIVLVALFGSQVWHEKRIDRLIRAVMARSLREAEYFQEQYKLDLDERKREMDEDRELRRKAAQESNRLDEEPVAPGKEKVRLEDFEEDWKKSAETALRT